MSFLTIRWIEKLVDVENDNSNGNSNGKSRQDGQDQQDEKP
jgi:hypothetical protein